MRKYITLFFLVTLFLFACGGSKTPAGILDRQHMISVLTDITIVDGSLYNYGANPDSVYKYGTGKYLALFKMHHIDSAEFSKSLNYYSTKPTEIAGIFDDVSKILKQKTDSLNNLNKIPVNHNKQQLQQQPLQQEHKPTVEQINFYKQQQIKNSHKQQQLKQPHGLPIK